MGYWRVWKTLMFKEGAVYDEVYDNGDSGASKTIVWNNSNKQKITLTANCTLTFTAPKGACSLQLLVIQDATGGRTLTFPTLKTQSGAGITISAGANAVDVVSFFFDGTSYYAMINLNFS